MRLHILVLGILAGLSSVASAQRNCKKGIPCGGSCIAASKVCRVGLPTPTTTRDTVKPTAIAPPTATPLAVQGATTSTALPTRSPGVYDAFAIALREWSGHSVTVRNSADPQALRPPAVLSAVESDYLVILAGPNRIMVPYSSIEMAYSDGAPTATSAFLVIVMRR